MRKLFLLPLMLALSLGAAFAQASPYNLFVFKAQSFTATGQTGAAIQLNGLPLLPGGSTVGSSYASGTITVTGTALTTASFQVMGSSDNGATYYLLPVYSVVNPVASPVTTVTATTSGLYQINLAGLTHIKLLTTGTFTATSVSVVLTGSPNASISRNGNGGGVLSLSSPDGTINVGGTGTAPTLDLNLALANTWTQGMTIENGLTLDDLDFTLDGEAITFPSGSRILEDFADSLNLASGNQVILSSGNTLQAILGAVANDAAFFTIQSLGAGQQNLAIVNNNSVGTIGIASGTSLLDSANAREIQLGEGSAPSGLPNVPSTKLAVGDVTTVIANTNIRLVGAVTGTSVNGVVNYCKAAGMACDGTTDDTTAFQNLLTAVATAGGATIQGPCGKTTLLLGQITIPSSPTTPWGMSPIRISGCGASFGAADVPAPTPPGNAFTIDARFAGSRILSLGLGTLEIDHLNLINGGSSCGTFIQTTLTNLKLHDNAILGNTAAGGTSSCDDVWLAGGTNGTNISLNGSINDFFQGYGSVVRDNFANYIRTFLIGRVAFNSVPVVNNEIGINSGSNSTTIVSAATNAAAAVLTSTAHSLPVGTGVTLTFSGFTGTWASLNGAHAITVIDANTFSVAINSTGFGALTGSPVYLSGAAFIIDGTAATGTNFVNSGNYIAGNLVEITNYPFAIKMGLSTNNNLVGTSCWDATSVSIACIWQQATTTNNYIQTTRFANVHLVNALSNHNGSTVFSSNEVYIPFGIFNGPLNIVNQGTASTFAAFSVFESGLASGNRLTEQFGINGSSFNSGTLNFKNVAGSGSTSNIIELGLVGAPSLTMDGLGNTTLPGKTSAPMFAVSGSTFTASGCSNSSLFGGSSAGTFTSGTTGTCTVVITTGFTAAHGWICFANDLTTPADTIKQTASSTTTATLSGTTTTADVINFHCDAF